jgi:hypothetical protein
MMPATAAQRQNVAATNSTAISTSVTRIVSGGLSVALGVQGLQRTVERGCEDGVETACATGDRGSPNAALP